MERPMQSALLKIECIEIYLHDAYWTSGTWNQ